MEKTFYVSLPALRRLKNGDTTHLHFYTEKEIEGYRNEGSIPPLAVPIKIETTLNKIIITSIDKCL